MVILAQFINPNKFCKEINPKKMTPSRSSSIKYIIQTPLSKRLNSLLLVMLLIKVWITFNRANHFFHYLLIYLIYIYIYIDDLSVENFNAKKSENLRKNTDKFKIKSIRLHSQGSPVNLIDVVKKETEHKMEMTGNR